MSFVATGSLLVCTMNSKYASRPDQYEAIFGPGSRVLLEKTMEEKLVV